MRKFKEQTIEKYKQTYILKSTWSENVKLMLQKIDFSKIVTQLGKIPENSVRLALIQFLKQNNYHAKDILNIIVNDRETKSLTVIGYFFKIHIFTDSFFHAELKKISNILKLDFAEKYCPNYVLFIRGKYHKCKLCDNLTLYIYCSQKCMGTDKERIERFVKNCTTDEAKKNRQDTCLALYGDTNVLGSNSTILKDVRANNVLKYGGENVMNGNSPLRKVAEDTMLRRYGKKHFNNTEKQKETNLKNLGVEYNTQLNFKNFDKLCAEYVAQHFVDTKKNRFLMDEFQDFFNLSQTVAYRYKKKMGFCMPSLHKRHSKPQTKLFDQIQCKSKLFNDRTILKPLELDIVLPEIKLAIEYDGVYWHSNEISSAIPTQHLNKTELCEQKGYQLFHIFESDDIEIWKSMINAKLGNVNRIFARKCQIVDITSSTAKAFCDINHLQGGVNSAVNIGLMHDNILVAVMTFSKPRFNKNYDWELIRYCQLKNTRVVGGAGKMLKYFRKTHIGSIISYANRRWSTGDLYKTLGFSFVRNTCPGFVFTKSGIIYSRLQLQKHKLKNMAYYDVNLTAEKILELEGFKKLYDCGNSVWELI